MTTCSLGLPFMFWKARREQEAVPLKTVVVTVCSRDKNKGGQQQSVSAQRLAWVVDPRSRAQPEIERLVPDVIRERLFRPAYVRYAGPIYREISPLLQSLQESSDLEFLIASGYYGIMDCREPIWNYELDLKKTSQVIDIWNNVRLGALLKKYLDEDLGGHQRLFVLTSDYRLMLSGGVADGLTVRPIDWRASSAQEQMQFYGQALAHLTSSRLIYEPLANIPSQQTRMGVRFQLTPV